MNDGSPRPGSPTASSGFHLPSHESAAEPIVTKPASPIVIKERYRLTRELSAGSVGKLYVGDDLATGAPVTVRLLGGESVLEDRLASALELHARRLATVSIANRSIAKVRELDR